MKKRLKIAVSGIIVIGRTPIATAAEFGKIRLVVDQIESAEKCIVFFQEWVLSRKILQYIAKRRNFQGQTTQKSLIIKRLTHYAEHINHLIK